ncbi:hypothetical protein PHLCEN_2v8255 [Hermanssonia centrifuga]|uniref:Mannosyltransferase n=1 Tax=Hermanssonia centrifuga TaxID=98765 RepID=A0A2R6NU16_9APHY|nr:hypothetical protein PHLCEN_2v8255 [Hermanssonia centrifuga]
MSTSLDVLLLATSWIHVLLAPYTKVEESFNLHATHDVLMYGVSSDALKNYDHFVFPGAVPRTFIGSVLLAWLSTPFIQAANALGLLSDKFQLQIAVRLALATYNVVGLSLLRRGVSRRYGGPAGVLFVLLTCTQFHLPFYMGRTWPNMFALLPVNIASFLLWNRAPNALRPTSKSVHTAIALLTFTTVVFRSEVLLLLGPLILQALISGYTSLSNIIKVGISAGLSSIALTVLVDSYFWQRWPLWPELYGIYFNVVQGNSSAWGVSPFSAYFTSHLPKLLLSSSILSVVGAVIDARVRALLWPAIVFVILLSVLPHKEWRFIVYVVPLFNVAAARGATWLVSMRKSNIIGRLCFLFVAGLLVANCVATYFFTVTSMANYPGGEALSRFNELYASRQNVHVHISNLAAQTGASLFLQTHAPPYLPGYSIAPPEHSAYWRYDKTENLTPTALTASGNITHAIAEITDRAAPNSFAATGFPKHQWIMTAVITGLERLRLDFARIKSMEPWKVLSFSRGDQLVILERRGQSQS